MPFDPGPFKGCYSVTSAERTFLMRYWGLNDRGETLKHPLQTDAAASSWLNQLRDDRKNKTRPRNKHQIIRQIRVDDRSKAYMSHTGKHAASVTSYVYEIRPKIRGPFECWPFLSLSRSVRRVGENRGNEVAPENRKKYCGVGLWWRENHPSVCVKIYFIELSTGNFNMHGFAVYIHVLKKVSHDWNGAQIFQLSQAPKTRQKYRFISI